MKYFDQRLKCINAKKEIAELEKNSFLRKIELDKLQMEEDEIKKAIIDIKNMNKYGLFYTLFLICACKSTNTYKDAILLDTCIGKKIWQIGYSDTISHFISVYDSKTFKELPKLYISYNQQKIAIELAGRDSILHNSMYYYENNKVNKASFFAFPDTLYIICVPQPIQVFSGLILVNIQNGIPKILPIARNPFGDKYLILGEPMVLQKEKKRIAHPLLEHHWGEEWVGDILVWEIEKDSVIYKGLLETDKGKINDEDSYIREIDSLLFYATYFKKYKRVE